MLSGIETDYIWEYLIESAHYMEQSDANPKAAENLGLALRAGEARTSCSATLIFAVITILLLVSLQTIKLMYTVAPK